MNPIQFREAAATDVSTLAAQRIEFLALVQQRPDPQTEAALLRSLEAYFGEHLGKSYRSWVACDGDRIVGMGGMSLREHPGNFLYPDGRQAYILNMYTLPEYRRRGISSGILARLVECGRALGIRSFELHATSEGEPVYQKFGFLLHGEPTYRLRFQD